ncbi:hypothetical protein CASFOL_009388 [Castilleja foliolosa]|uniref:CID domain-containing protein n=1 Tax=Castilleja foliolosa TaxID=1961234 RepID=A0ABD3DY89_9LAMI
MTTKHNEPIISSPQAAQPNPHIINGSFLMSGPFLCSPSFTVKNELTDFTRFAPLLKSQIIIQPPKNPTPLSRTLLSITFGESYPQAAILGYTHDLFRYTVIYRVKYEIFYLKLGVLCSLIRMDTRRQFNRSLSKEPGLKKPRLSEDPAAPDRMSNGRTGFFQRPAVPNSGVGGGMRALRDRDSEVIDPVRGSYQPQSGQHLHQELVTQYKTALSELTFNSKPIITNLTIIAGESLQAAKAIAATICANIIEVPSEQKLPSLYLLDSIVKNIGRDYIKYFASRLPEVFCKAYRQVDSTIRTGMRHLFRTWKGVFPPQTLQLIEKELGFTTAPNGSSSAATTSRPEPQPQHPAHSIHVNPKYLEARQRLQTTSRARGSGSDISEDVETLERTASISSGKPWAVPYAKAIQPHHHLRDQVTEPIRDKSSSMAYSDSEYVSAVSGRAGLGTDRLIEKVKEPGCDRTWYASGSDITGIPQKKNGFGQKHRFESHATHDPVDSDFPHPKHKDAITNSNSMSGNWKNSEEEEYVWEEMNTRPTVRSSTDALTKDHWTPDNYDRLDFDNHLQRSPNIHDDDDASADSMSLDLDQVAPGTQLPMWSKKFNPPEARLCSGTGKSVSDYSEGHPTGKSSQSSLGKTYSLSQMGSVHIGAPSLKKFPTDAMLGPNVPLTQPQKAVGATSSLTRSVMHQRPPSPFSLQNPQTQLLNNVHERNQSSVSLPTDPRRPLRHKNMVSCDQFPDDPSRDQDSAQRAHIKNSRSSAAAIPPTQQKKYASSAQPRKNLEVHTLLGSQISGSESRSMCDQSNPLTVDSPGKSITSSLFDAVGRSGIPKSTTISARLTKSSSQETRPRLISTPSQTKVEQPSLKTPNAVSSTSDPVSSLLSSLVAKGLISSSSSSSSSKSESVSPNKISDHPLGIVSSLPVTSSKPFIPIKDEPSLSEPAVNVSDSLPESPIKIKNLIGFVFRPDVLRDLHPDVISDLLSDIPHQCSICGLRLKLQERLDRHMEWHALRVPDDNNPSRNWYADLVDWVDRMGPLEISGFSDDEILDCGPMVPADESQCVCVLCGELFEDFYSQESDEWMFKGAVYLTEPSSESRELVSTTSGSAVFSPIVHANCLSEDTVRDLGMNCDVKLETDE